MPSIPATERELATDLQREYPSLYPDASVVWIPVGWSEIAWRLSAALRDTDLAVTQAKEKFGGLRFVVRGTRTQATTEAIHAAVGDSWITCDMCGNHGVLRDQGWLAVRCEDHADALRSSPPPLSC